MDPISAILALVAFGGGGYGLSKIFDRGDIDRARHAPPGSFRHDTAWVFCPGVGSWSMMANGRDVMTRVFGTVFFPLDVMGVAPLVRGTGALVKLTPQALSALTRIAR